MSNNNNKLRKEVVLPPSGSAAAATAPPAFDKTTIKARLSEIKTQVKGLNSEQKALEKQLTKFKASKKAAVVVVKKKTKNGNKK